MLKEQHDTCKSKGILELSVSLWVGMHTLFLIIWKQIVVSRNYYLTVKPSFNKRIIFNFALSLWLSGWPHVMLVFTIEILFCVVSGCSHSEFLLMSTTVVLECLIGFHDILVRREEGIRERKLKCRSIKT